ncbi:hypothetical protein AIOGIFDO_01656 [Candidatus Methanoperedenaceae archaeon GB37]|nr:hypothetical protein AIOGIFDO_01656 [Candidatus Methanoperedenaceae archaeon GB37]
MNDFEHTLKKSFNEFFIENNIRGICHRLKQSPFETQLVDLLVDSLDPDYYLAIECKSIDATKTNALYFTQHFTIDRNNLHQVARISDFLYRSGRRGLLAVELRLGSGRKKNAYMIPWREVVERFNNGVGFTIDEIQEYAIIQRKKGLYVIDPKRWQNNSRIKEKNERQDG